MSDIYKNNQRMPGATPEPKRRRRSKSRSAFDETGERQRRSRNRGARRMLHLSRKGENEKIFWWGTAVVLVVILLLVAFWQFVVLNNRAKQESDEVLKQKHQSELLKQSRPFN